MTAQAIIQPRREQAWVYALTVIPLRVVSFGYAKPRPVAGAYAPDDGGNLGVRRARRAPDHPAKGEAGEIPGRRGPDPRRAGAWIERAQAATTAGRPRCRGGAKRRTDMVDTGHIDGAGNAGVNHWGRAFSAATARTMSLRLVSCSRRTAILIESLRRP